MVNSTLLQDVLSRAVELGVAWGYTYVAAPAIVIACCEKCAEKYYGVSENMDCLEEERLRYIVSKAIRPSVLCKKYTKTAVDNRDRYDVPFNFDECEEILTKRGEQVITADVVFLCALKTLPNDDFIRAQGFREDMSVEAVSEDVDANIYDYTLTKLTEIRDKLNGRISRLQYLRDYHEADKFAEPQELKEQFCSSVSVNSEKNVLSVTVPNFFSKTDLKLNICKNDDYYYVHDCGCAIENLKQSVGNDRACIVAALMCDNKNLQGDKLCAVVSKPNMILELVQRLTLVANGHLFYKYFDNGPLVMGEDMDFKWTPQETIEVEEFENLVAFQYDAERGLILHIDTKYTGCDNRASILIETLENGKLRFSDGQKNHKYETGEMLAMFYWGSDEKTDPLYYELMQKLSAPFGMNIDINSEIIFPEYKGFIHTHKNPYMLSDPAGWVQDIYKFMNCAVILSVLVQHIQCDKIREW